MRIATCILFMSVGVSLVGTVQKAAFEKTANLNALQLQQKGGRSERKLGVSLSPDAFRSLFAGTVRHPSLTICEGWINAASALRDEILEQLDVTLYEEVPDHLHLCIKDHAALTPSDLRKAALTIYRFDQAEQKLFLIVNVDRGKQIAEQQKELKVAKNEVEDATAKYNGLDILYKQLHSDYAALEIKTQSQHGYPGNQCDEQNHMLTECFSMAQKAFQNGLDAGRQIYSSSITQQTECKSELIGWTLVTKCK